MDKKNNTKSYTLDLYIKNPFQTKVHILLIGKRLETERSRRVEEHDA